MLNSSVLMLVRLTILGVAAFIIFLRYIGVRFYRAKYNEPVKPRYFKQYSQSELFATGSPTKRDFMEKSNRLFYAWWAVMVILFFSIIIPLLK